MLDCMLLGVLRRIVFFFDFMKKKKFGWCYVNYVCVIDN